VIRLLHVLWLQHERSIVQSALAHERRERDLLPLRIKHWERHLAEIEHKLHNRRTPRNVEALWPRNAP